MSVTPGRLSRLLRPFFSLQALRRRENTADAQTARSDSRSSTRSPFVFETLEPRLLLSAGLTAGYAFDETAGTTAADASGHAIVGTLTNGPTWTTGQHGNAVNLDGVNDYVTLGNPTALQVTGSLTLSGWINASAFPVDDGAVVSKRASGESGFQLDVTVDTGPRTIGFKLTNSAGANMFRYGATTLQPNTWYYIAGVYDAATQSLHVYLNGQLDDGVLQGTVTASQQNSTANVTIGRRAGVTGFEFAGRVDDVRIYDRALTAAEIQADMVTSLGIPDTVAPTVQAINRVGPTSTNAASVQWTITFSENVTGVDFTDFALVASGVVGATLTSVTPVSGATYTVTASTGTGNGTLGLNLVDNDSILDLSANRLGGTGLVNGDFTGQSYSIDKTAPTGTLVINGGAVATNSRNATLTLSATDALSGVTQMRFSNTGTSFSSAEAYASTKAWTLTTGAGTKTVYVQYRDGAGNWSTAAITDTIVLDTTAPTISARTATNITSSSATITWTTNEAATSQVNYGLTTSYGFTTTLDSTLVTAHSVTITGLAPSTTYNYRVRSRDAAGNETVSANSTFVTAVGADTVAPTVQSINRVGPTPTNVASVQWTVTFSESVTGVDTGDFALAASGVSGATISTVTGSGTTYTVTASTGTGNGTLGLNLVDNDSIVDLSANRLGGTGLVNGDFTGQSYSIDKTAPSVTINQAAGQADPTNASPINFTVLFSETVTGFTAADISFAGSTVSGPLTAVVTGTGPTYNVAVSGMTGTGSVVASVLAGAATDAAGNGSLVSTSTDNTVTFNATAFPTVLSINRVNTNPTNVASVQWTVTFSESVTGVDTADFTLVTTGTVAGATITSVTGSGTTYTVTASTGTGNGTLGLNLVDNDTIINGVSAPVGGAGTGNGNFTGQSYTIDKTVQTAGLTAGYAFDELAGTTAADASGHGLVGTLTNGPTWTPGRYGNALTLDGVNDYVTLGNPTALQVTGSLTLSGWINASAFPVDDGAVVSKRASGESGFQLDVTVDKGPRTIGFKLTNSAGANMFRYGATTLLPNTWYYIAGVYDAATQSLHVYLNGQLDDGVLQGTVTASQQNSTANVTIGRRAGVTGFEFAGRVDDVRIYARALTVAEIQSDMLNPVGTIGSADPNPPVVQLNQPSDGALVTDIVVVTALATDDVGVAGVQFYVDGVPTGSLDTVGPYALTWDTRTVSNGAHTLMAQAYDTSGNAALSLPVTVNVSNINYFRNEILATGFNLPTAIKFLPDGRMLVAELTGTIKVLPPPYTSADPTPFLQLNLNIPGYAGLQQGIFDIALDPNFTTNRYYYVFYTNDTPNRDRLSRFTANATLDGTVPGSEVILYEDPQTPNTEHHGGAINFDNGGMILVTTGDHFLGTPSQDLTSPRGKILRISPVDGSAAPGNPFSDGSGGNDDRIWALGLRNPYRAYYDAPTGRLFIGDVGGNDNSTSIEEVNVGVRGANYGWPNVEGPSSNPAYTNPIYSYPHNGRDAAVTSGFVYHGSQFPSSYQGNYFFADYTQNWIRRLTFDANGTVTGVFNFEPADGSVDGPYGDIVYLTEGPEGALYYVDLGYSDVGGTFGVSKIRRIEFVQSNLPPVVAASATPAGGPVPLTVNFSSAGSSDPEGGPLTYSWNFGDGAAISTGANPTHTYTIAGPYQVRLTISDGVNSTLSPPLSISAGNRPVIANLLATVPPNPANNGLFRAGDVISFSATATDIEDGTLSASAYKWNIDFLHEGHVHPGATISGVTGGSFTIPTSGHDFSGNTRYRITLTVTDSSGLQSSQSTIVFPDKVNLTFDTAPTGLTLYVDGIAHQGPFVYDTLIGFNHTIEARNQTVSTSSYTFASWSDGGAQQHTITVPVAAQSYTANYTVVTNPLPAGLAAGWSFNEASGTSATDSSGNNNAATLVNGVARTTGNYGGGLTFDGVNDYLTVPNSPSLNISGTGLTLSMWINPQALSGGDSVVLGKFWNATMTSPYYQYGLELAGGTVPVFYVGTTGGVLSASMGSALALNQWSHLAVVFNGSQVMFYLNGALVTTASLPATITARSNPFQLGADNNTQQFFKGSLDEVRIYNRALSAQEILTDKNTPS